MAPVQRPNLRNDPLSISDTNSVTNCVVAIDFKLLSFSCSLTQLFGCVLGVRALWNTAHVSFIVISCYTNSYIYLCKIPLESLCITCCITLVWTWLRENSNNSIRPSTCTLLPSCLTFKSSVVHRYILPYPNWHRVNYRMPEQSTRLFDSYLENLFILSFISSRYVTFRLYLWFLYDSFMLIRIIMSASRTVL